VGKLFDELKQDILYQHGMNACLNCGVCTAVCPAAEFNDYSPREVMNICQSEDYELIEELLKSDKIWYCGQCFSCKTRCPRGNSTASVVLALRRMSIRHGYFAESEKGRQQLFAKRVFGENILKRRYCLSFIGCKRFDWVLRHLSLAGAQHSQPSKPSASVIFTDFHSSNSNHSKFR
jgi:heterodisulfide reductase subunit C